MNNDKKNQEIKEKKLMNETKRKNEGIESKYGYHTTQ